MKKCFTLFIISFFISVSIQAQDSLFLRKEFIFKGDTLRYRVLFPDNYSKNKKYPLVIFFHGSGECGNDNEKQLKHGASLFEDQKNRTNFPAIVIFPQCPATDSWVNFKVTGPNTFVFIDNKKPTKALEMTKILIDFYQKTEAVDKKRIYVSGLSLGGMATYDLICRYPKTFAAAIPMCGAVEVVRLEKVRKMPIRIYHGANDDAVSVEYARNAYNELKANGSKTMEYIEFPGVGHNCWYNAFSQPDFLIWMFSKHK